MAVEGAQRCTLNVTFTPEEASSLREWRLVWAADSEDGQPLRIVASEGSAETAAACDVRRDKDGDRGARIDTAYFCGANPNVAPSLSVQFVVEVPSAAPARIAVIPVLRLDGRMRASVPGIGEATINGGSDSGYPPQLVDVECSNTGEETTYRVFGAYLGAIRDAHIRQPASRSAIPVQILSRSKEALELKGPLLEQVGTGFMEVRNRGGQWTAIPIDWATSGLSRAIPPRIVIQLERGALGATTDSSDGDGNRAVAIAPGVAEGLTRAGVVTLNPVSPMGAGESTPSRATNLLGEPIELDRLDDWFVATLDLNADAAAVTARVRGVAGVREAFEDSWLHLAQLTPNDLRFGEQWGLQSLGGTVCGYPAYGIDIGAVSAWDQTTGSPGVRLAIIDSGINADHEDFGVNRVVVGKDIVHNVEGGAYDDNGHGTAVAGVATALGNNNTGVAGVAWQVQPWAVKVLNEYNLGSATNIAQGIQWATAQGIPIMNLSLGWAEGAAGVTPAARHLVALSILDAFKRGYFVVAASGNAEDGYRFNACPADLDERVYAVGAFLPSGNRWTDSELGITNCGFDPCQSSNYGGFLDAMAPGGRLITTMGLGATDYLDLSNCVQYDGSTMAGSGTSMAAPFVSGIAGLLMSRRPDLIGEDIAQILNRTTLGPYPPETWFEDYGWGRVRASSALNFVASDKVVAHWTVGAVPGSLGPLEVTEVTPNRWKRFLDVPGMPSADYSTSCVRYRLRATVTWPFPFSYDVQGWTRSSGTLGWKDVELYDYDAEVDTATFVTSTFGPTGATIETFVFQVMDASNPSQPIGWFPTDPAHARVGLTVIGPTAGTTDAGPSRVAARLAVTTLPNPSHGAVKMAVDVPMRGPVRATVLDLTGRRIATLVERELEAGRHEFRWDGTAVDGGRCRAGVYFCRVDCGGIATMARFVRLGSGR